MRNTYRVTVQLDDFDRFRRALRTLETAGHLRQLDSAVTATLARADIATHLGTARRVQDLFWAEADFEVVEVASGDGSESI